MRRITAIVQMQQNQWNTGYQKEVNCEYNIAAHFWDLTDKIPIQ